MNNEIKDAFRLIQDNFKKLEDKSSVISEIANKWIEALSNGNKVIFCGNGGSAADSQHLLPPGCPP